MQSVCGNVARLNDQFAEFVREANLATLATLRGDGSPSLSTVWYEYGGDGVVRLMVTRERMKYRHMRRDARVALCITGQVIPYKQVVFEGQAQLVGEGVEELVRRLCVRYYGAEEGEKYAAYSLGRDSRVVVELRPVAVYCWDFAVEDDHHRPWGYDVSGLGGGKSEGGQ